MYLRNVILAALVLALATAAFALDSQGPVLAVTDAPYQVRYAANLSIGESYINILNDGFNGTSPNGPGLGGAVGNICVNVYAFDPNEEMIACCSCLVTPDQVVNLGVNRDLTSNTQTGVVPASVTVKLVATLAGTGGTGTSCAASAAAGLTTATIVEGMVAFGTTLHATPVSGTYATTETRFAPAALSDSEVTGLANRCTGIVGNSSQHGICASCRAGALGASKM